MILKKTRARIALLCGFLFFIPASVFAGTESGFYFGAGLGNATVVANGIDSSNPASEFDESDSSYKLIGGFNFGIIPLIDIAVEASYIDFGNPSGTLSGGGSFEFDVTGLNVTSIFGLSFGPLVIFAKAGVIDWDSKSALGSQSGSGSSYGVGAKFQFASVAVQIEYEDFDVASLKELTMTSTTVTYTF